ncbi:MAG: hypothetical protein ACIAQF_10210 [Phycisphaerales bacterium JB065]
MTTRTLLLCCGAIAAMGLIPAPGASASVLTTRALQPAANQDPLAFPGSVLEYAQLIIPAGETLVLQGPIELRVGGEVRIEGKLVVDGVESTGRPNLTIKSLGPITIGQDAVLQTLNFGPGTDGGSIRLFCAETIELHGKLIPGSGTEGLTAGQHGGSGGDVFIDAPILRTTTERIEASHGGDAGPAGNGGKGGSVEIRAAVIWMGEKNRRNTSIAAGNGGRGGDGIEGDELDLRNAGDGGAGGNAICQPYRVPHWLVETGLIEDAQDEARRSYAANEGKNGQPDLPGESGQRGVNAMSGSGGDGGNGCNATLKTEVDKNLIRFIPPGDGGNGGDGGFAGGGDGGNGGRGGSPYGLPPDHPKFDAEGGNGGDGGFGGNAVAGDGGDAGLGGIYPFEDFVPPQIQGQAAHNGHPGHAGQANGGSGGHGGHGGHGYGPPSRGGKPGEGGTSTPGRQGADGKAIRRGEGKKQERGIGITGHTGHPGHDGRSMGDKPAD